ncbi:peroxiredoxin family protein [Hymenobacter lapidiphilus]|uniref:TlpA family protein disulfide reductase n=1 Tax=Hymenobacter lapidiphilus TaxID=2608003 RepID=A0A7Y7PR55_9BACT|nr:TlpA disulfide reductase family protein [Hymenobacter lapidiphilus]NVO32531.1 TlpA family protein disulfide reductase [Hymenobacter lapidiphilus]
MAASALLLLGSCQRLGAPATPGAATQNRRDNRPASPDFDLPTAAGKQLTLMSLRGSYVLLDFRAVGCTECAAENANLRKLYDQFSHRGLVIVSVWQASDQAEWRTALTAEELPWAQALDLSGETARAYEVQPPPVAVLLDPRGHELARNLRGRNLGQKISEFIPLD